MLKLSLVLAASLGFAAAMPVTVGPRPYWLIDQMRNTSLKTQLGKTTMDISHVNLNFP